VEHVPGSFGRITQNFTITAQPFLSEASEDATPVR